MPTNSKNNTVFFIILLILILGMVYFIFDPSENLFFPSCSFKAITGLDCPGCGSQRAIHELLHLNIKKAFEYNALFVISIPYILLGITLNFKGMKNRFPKTRNFLFARKTILLILSIIILFFIFRNL
jgi:hypothetical protein